MRAEAGSDEEESGHIHPIDESETTWDLVELHAPAVSDPIWNRILQAHWTNNIDVFLQEILRRRSGQRVLNILRLNSQEIRSILRVSDVPWYAEATRRARVTRNHHAERRSRIQRERELERERQREEHRMQREQPDERQRDESRIRQEQLEERPPYIDELQAMIDASFAIDTDFLSLDSTFPTEGQGPSSRADPPPSTIEQGPSQRLEVSGPENRQIAEDNTVAQGRERGFNEGNSSGSRHGLWSSDNNGGNRHGSFTALMEYIRSRRSGPRPFRE